jgi:Helicase conserved C-terminal domain
MAERDEMVVALVREILGPRSGPLESLPFDQNPRSEYITGVLAPAASARQPENMDADVDELPVTRPDVRDSKEPETLTGEEDDADQAPLVVPGVFSPALNPKDLPRTIGLSFTVQPIDGPPRLEVCATWARYQLDAQTHEWRRDPSCFLTGVVVANHDALPWQAGPGVSLRMRAWQLPGRPHWRISLFLVNETPVPQDRRAETPDYIFQPQIRVRCCEGTEVVPVRSYRSDDPEDLPLPGIIAAEDASLEMLYTERRAYARGHLCGAIWRGIDPERPHLTISSPADAPFAWTDIAVVPQTERAKFTPADVRTELVPCYPIQAPEMDWNSRYGPAPELDLEILAETWQPEQVRERLQPLADGYLAWIEEQQRRIASLSAATQPLADHNLRQCRQAADRISRAVDVLATDEDVRLAFCFANKAISMQAGWRGQHITWRPFQIAFLLLNIPALADPLHPDRLTCDLLWFPTGGGKTESYLGLTAFTLALRRLRARRRSRGQGPRAHAQDRVGGGGGSGVLSRYTLRLLTIQQFRRALGVLTACELLRVHGLDNPAQPVGWRPQEYPDADSFLWGGARFSAGLWVGGGVTPNDLQSIGPVPTPSGRVLYLGALDILQGAKSGYNGPNQALQNNIRYSRLEGGGEPAQVLNCPVCGEFLALPDDGLSPGQHTLHFGYQVDGAGQMPATPALGDLNHERARVDDARIIAHHAPGYGTLAVTFTVPQNARLTSDDVDQWGWRTLTPALGQGARLLSARPARPGYFILSYTTSQNHIQPCDFDVYCPRPGCELNSHAWAEQVPLSRANSANPAAGTTGTIATARSAALPPTTGLQWQEVPDAFRCDTTRWIAGRVPIPACTVDDQVYRRCPSLVIATVDKFARLAFEPAASSLFGNVDHYHGRSGYYREGSPPTGSSSLPASRQDHPPGRSGNTLRVQVPEFLPPDLILQDELHLIEGPLGSMVGIYETAIDLLCQRREGGQVVVPKYLASTATVRQAEPQVQALFDRRLAQFPPPALSADERFFATEREVHPLESARPGRLYVGVAAPGQGPLTPSVRVWSVLLQRAYELWQRDHTRATDHYYTLVGYFNAIRELAGVVSLYRQDIPERLNGRLGTAARPLPPDRWVELSSRGNSLDLPVMLKRLENEAPDALDAVFTTSMFGTGVDVSRLSMMVVQGQPKTTASYIQATGRVGRQDGGLVVVFLRASRPRDLDHYEFFAGYHRALYRYVEPVTVAPFSPRARERALGPLAVVLLRHARDLNGRPVSSQWAVQQRLAGSTFLSEAPRMATSRNDPEVTVIPELLERRAAVQPDGRRPPGGVTAQEAESELDRWRSVAEQYPDPNRLVYDEPAMNQAPQRHVVLGDGQHQARADLETVYENTPQSLRDVESTTGFKS